MAFMGNMSALIISNVWKEGTQMIVNEVLLAD